MTIADKKQYPPITFEYSQEEIAAKAGIKVENLAICQLFHNFSLQLYLFERKKTLYLFIVYLKVMALPGLELDT